MYVHIYKLSILTGDSKHESAVTSLQLHGKFVVTSSDDGTVKLWDAKTGQVIKICYFIVNIQG